MNEWTWLGIALVYPGIQLGRILYQLYSWHQDKIIYRRKFEAISEELHDRWKRLGLE